APLGLRCERPFLPGATPLAINCRRVAAWMPAVEDASLPRITLPRQRQQKPPALPGDSPRRVLRILCRLEGSAGQDTNCNARANPSCPLPLEGRAGEGGSTWYPL